MVFSIADNRVAHRQKLRSDLILQPRYQLNPDERSIRKKAFDGISKFGTGYLSFSRRAQLLKHSFTSKVVHERPRRPRSTARYCLTGVWSRNCGTSASRSGPVFPDSKAPGGKTNRKLELRRILGKQNPISRLLYANHLRESGSALFQRACELDLEGIIAK